MPTHFFRRKAAARYVQETWGVPLSPNTLSKFAVVGGGPTYRTFGRFPVYTAEDLDAWVRTRLSPKVASTAALVAVRPEQPAAMPQPGAGLRPRG
jgi:hypothetical protein